MVELYCQTLKLAEIESVRDHHNHLTKKLFKSVVNNSSNKLHDLLPTHCNARCNLRRARRFAHPLLRKKKEIRGLLCKQVCLGGHEQLNVFLSRKCMSLQIVMLDFIEVFTIFIISIVKSSNSVRSAKCLLIKHSLSLSLFRLERVSCNLCTCQDN